MDCDETTSCEKKKNCCGTGCSMTDEMIHLAERAWQEVLIEKIKVLYQKHNGEKMDKVAQAAFEACNVHWENGMRTKMGVEESKNKVRQSFMH